MIKGVHTMFYTSEANELRAFLRDKLGLNSFKDTGDGWLIFNLPEADGLVTNFKMPGDFEAQLYQPSYTKNKD